MRQDGGVKNRSLAASVFVTLAVVVSGLGPWPGFLVVGTLLVLTFAIGWPYYLGLPARKTLATLIAVVGLISMLIAQFASGPSLLGWLAPVSAAGVVAVFVVQLIRGTGQSHRLESLFGSVAGIVLATSAAGWVAVPRLSGGDELLAISGGCAVVVLLLSMLSWPDRIVAPLGLLVGGLVGSLMALMFAGRSLLGPLVTALVVSSVLLAFRRMTTMARPTQSAWGQLGLAVAPVLALGAVVYFAGRMFPF